MSNDDADRRALDAEVAVALFGWQWKRGEHWDITSVPGDAQLHLLEPDDAVVRQRPGEFTSIGDWPPQDGRIIWSHLPHYASDIGDAWLVEDEIGRRGGATQDAYIKALVEIVAPNWSSVGIIWKAIRATPEQRCMAALAAVRREEPSR